jgi:hypothetical protein
MLDKYFKIVARVSSSNPQGCAEPILGPIAPQSDIQIISAILKGAHFI